MFKISALCVYYLSLVMNSSIEYYDNEYQYYKVLGNYKDYQQATIVCMEEIEGQLLNRD